MRRREVSKIVVLAETSRESPKKQRAVSSNSAKVGRRSIDLISAYRALLAAYIRSTAAPPDDAPPLP